MLTQEKTAKARTMNRADALAAGRWLAEKLIPFTEEAEVARRMPAAAADLVQESGLMPLVRPARYGGYQLDWQTLTDIVSDIARTSSASLGWCTSFLLQHQWMLSYFPEEAQDFVYAVNPDPRIVTSFAPTGVATKVDGGYRVNGTWSFGSGGDNCTWAVVGCRLAEPEADKPRGVWVLLKQNQFRMNDVWNSVGLKGSGSNDIVIEDAFVADGFSLNAARAYAGTGPSREFLDGPMFMTGLAPQFQFALFAPLLGAGRGLLETYVEANRNKMHALGAGRAAENPFLHMRVGESEADIEAAYAIIESLNRKLMAGELMGADGPMVFWRGMGVAAKLVNAAAERLYQAAGARGLTEGSPMARHRRDVLAITNHIALQPETLFVPPGRAAFERPQA